MTKFCIKQKKELLNRIKDEKEIKFAIIEDLQYPRDIVCEEIKSKNSENKIRLIGIKEDE
ncbi:hypothetical protein KLL34_15380 [Clostridioides difficile]|uniref:hypothetical protein n=1 Tax=Clostridioides difficile TaxID=1496 RepID=UPI00097FF5AA|nr:hypothetical protein [Clostridioides difficile]MCI4242574.1 hypothetical protein [Clostridioides difficile]MDB9601623.1 hypothetical protein [Clostridioides difficile]MDN9362614.1 hypothetical protein [Clostridioides difficile]MDN9410387.1 hypothetical protein [Clostridioides difficile]MDN9511032.1 hypothetical protein [Clostridioides difficile]